ncbi:MAG: hypothetical protein LBG73_09040 [Spirochaetaceae bacterium]|nr:hypothetical protein [Spirochaetaceae bacterium]
MRPLRILVEGATYHVTSKIDYGEAEGREVPQATITAEPQSPTLSGTTLTEPTGNWSKKSDTGAGASAGGMGGCTTSFSRGAHILTCKEGKALQVWMALLRL